MEPEPAESGDAEIIGDAVRETFGAETPPPQIDVEAAPAVYHGATLDPVPAGHLGIDPPPRAEVPSPEMLAGFGPPTHEPERVVGERALFILYQSGERAAEWLRVLPYERNVFGAHPSTPEGRREWHMLALDLGGSEQTLYLAFARILSTRTLDNPPTV